MPEPDASASDPGYPGRFAPVSVVIPCFGSAATMERAVASVAAQSRPPAEVIVVDDGNADDVRRMLAAVQQKYGDVWLKIVSLPVNVGPADARNAGWDTAREDLLAFLDVDDSWHPRKLELQCELMLQNPQAALCAHASTQLGEEKELEMGEPASGFRSIGKNELLVSNRFTTPTVMVRRSLAYRFRSRRRHMEDHLLWMKIACDGHTLLRMDAILAYTFKPPYGRPGQSGELWNMEKAELENYVLLWRSGRIGLPAAVALLVLSGLKFLRRLLLVAAVRIGLARSLPARHP